MGGLLVSKMKMWIWNQRYELNALFTWIMEKNEIIQNV